jgi:hypothetical protein
MLSFLKFGLSHAERFAMNSAIASAMMNVNSVLTGGRPGDGFGWATPEPATALLIGSALIGIAILSKRFRQE